MKKSVCGNGMAEKEQIQRMVRILLSLGELPQNDAADALGMAICHANAKSLIQRQEAL
jgi:crossover junction endodeoxyribonuclease RuvC